MLKRTREHQSHRAEAQHVEITERTPEGTRCCASSHECMQRYSRQNTMAPWKACLSVDIKCDRVRIRWVGACFSENATAKTTREITFDTQAAEGMSPDHNKIAQKTIYLPSCQSVEAFSSTKQSCFVCGNADPAIRCSLAQWDIRTTIDILQEKSFSTRRIQPTCEIQSRMFHRTHHGFKYKGLVSEAEPIELQSMQASMFECRTS